MTLKSLKSLFLVAFLGLVLVSVNDVQAKKMGSGSSMGKQSNTVTKNQSSLPPKSEAAPVNSAAKPGTPAAAAAPAAAAPSRFGGMGGILGGIAAGIGLSYLFSQMGLGGEMGSMLSNLIMVLGVAFLGFWLYKKFANRNGSNATMSTGVPGMNFSQAQPAAGSFNSQQIASSSNANASSYASGTTGNTSSSTPAPMIANAGQMSLAQDTPQGVQSSLTPTSFADKDNFLVNAKSLFLQLQEASDQQNIDTLKEYTSPELFTQLRQDMLTRTTAVSFTQVLTLAADLIAVEEENNEFLASVRFSGSIREEVNGPAEDFAEVWNWSKPMDQSSGWILCGIQQIN